MNFYVWDPDHGDRPEAPNVIGVYDEGSAAESFAERKWADYDCPESMSLLVEDAQGKRWRVRVEVQCDPTFHARRVTEEGAAT